MNTAEEALAALFSPIPSSAKARLHHDVFGPRPAELVPFLQSVKARFGEDSYEYAQQLLEMGDAQMVQCERLAALASYESALTIYKKAGEDSLLTAWTYDKLANARMASDDLAGAVADLSRAVAVWDHAAEAPLPEHITRRIARRREDWEQAKITLAFLSRKSPEP